MTLTALGILRQAGKPEDKLWTALHQVDKETAELFQKGCLEHALGTYDPKHPDAEKVQYIFDAARKYCAEGLKDAAPYNVWYVTRALAWTVWKTGDAGGERWRAEEIWQVEHLRRILEE